MDFKEKLLLLRKSYNMTQDDLAKKLNVSRQAVQKWEVGASYPKMEKLQMISKIFACSINDLIGLEDMLLNKGRNFTPSKSALILLLLNFNASLVHLILNIATNYNAIWLFLCSIFPSLLSYFIFHRINIFTKFENLSHLNINKLDKDKIFSLKKLFYKMCSLIMLFLLIINILSFLSFIKAFNYNNINLVIFIIEIFGFSSLAFITESRLKKYISNNLS